MLALGFRSVDLNFDVSRRPKLQLRFHMSAALPLWRFSDIAGARSATEWVYCHHPRQLPKKCRNLHGESRRVQCPILRGGAIRFRSTSGETTLEESELIRVARFWFVTKSKDPVSSRAFLLGLHAMVHKLRYKSHALIELFLSNAFGSSLEASPGFRLSGKPPGCPFRGSATVRWQRALHSAADLSAERGFRSIPRIARTRQSVRRIGANCGLDRGVNSRTLQRIRVASGQTDWEQRTE